MAYINRTFSSDPWDGPFPDKAGEFCGNAPRKDVEVGPDGIVVRRWFPRAGQLEPTWEQPPTQRRIGRPSPCQRGTSDEMAAEGYVGLYLTQDTNWQAGRETRPVDTDALTEEVVSGQRQPERPFKLDS